MSDPFENIPLVYGKDGKPLYRYLTGTGPNPGRLYVDSPKLVLPAQQSTDEAACAKKEEPSK